MLVLVQVFIAMWSCPSALYVMLAIIETVFAEVNIFTLCTCVNIYTFRLGTMTPKLNEYVGDICDLFSEECRPRNSKNTAEDCHASRPLVACCWWLRMVYIHYIAKRIYSPIQIIECRCSNHFHGLMCIISSTLVCRLLLQTFVYELVALRSSVISHMVPW